MALQDCLPVGKVLLLMSALGVMINNLQKTFTKLLCKRMLQHNNLFTEILNALTQ